MGSTKNKNVVPKALPNYDEEFFRSLTRNVVLVGNEVNLITPTKTDKKHSRKIDKEENSEVDNVTVRRNVFNKNNPYYAKCVAIKTEWEKWFKDNTIPYFGRGLGLVTTANYQQFAKENSEFARRYNKALKEFFANYESIIQGSFIFGKGSKRAIELASTLDQVKAKCGAKHSVAPFGDYIQSNGAKGRTAFSIVAQETNKVVSGAVKKVTDTIFSNVIKEFSRLCHGTGETKGGYLVARSEGLKNNLSGNSTAIYSNRIDGCGNSLDDLEKKYYSVTSR